MILHILDWTRPRKERELIRARLERQAAYEAYRKAEDRQDKRLMGASAADLRAATTKVLRLEVGR